VQQQLAAAYRIRIDVGAGGDQGLEAGAEQEGFSILSQHIGFGQVAFPGTQ